MWKRIVCLLSGHVWGPIEHHEVEVTAYLHHRVEGIVVILERACERCGKKERV